MSSQGHVGRTHLLSQYRQFAGLFLGLVQKGKIQISGGLKTQTSSYQVQLANAQALVVLEHHQFIVMLVILLRAFFARKAKNHARAA